MSNYKELEEMIEQQVSQQYYTLAMGIVKYLYCSNITDEVGYNQYIRMFEPVSSSIESQCNSVIGNNLLKLYSVFINTAVITNGYKFTYSNGVEIELDITTGFIVLTNGKRKCKVKFSNCYTYDNLYSALAIIK